MQFKITIATIANAFLEIFAKNTPSVKNSSFLITGKDKSKEGQSKSDIFEPFQELRSAGKMIFTYLCSA